MKAFVFVSMLLLPLSATAEGSGNQMPTGWVWPEADGFDPATTYPLSDDAHAFGPDPAEGVSGGAIPRAAPAVCVDKPAGP